MTPEDIAHLMVLGGIIIAFLLFMYFLLKDM